MRPRPDFTLDAPNPGQLKATKTRNQQPRPAQMCCSPRGAPLYASRVKPNRGTKAYIGKPLTHCNRRSPSEETIVWKYRAKSICSLPMFLGGSEGRQ